VNRPASFFEGMPFGLGTFFPFNLRQNPLRRPAELVGLKSRPFNESTIPMNQIRLMKQ